MEPNDRGLFTTMDSVHFVHEFALYFFLVCCFFLIGLRGGKLQETKDDCMMRSFMVYAYTPNQLLEL
jgi:hypothetical protein